MFARIFREDISEADLRKAGLKNPEQSQRRVRIRREPYLDPKASPNALVPQTQVPYKAPAAPAKVAGTKPLNIFDPADYLALRAGSDKVRADAGLLYTQAQHGMGWLPGADMTGMFGASLADFHPSRYITDVTPSPWPGATFKGEKIMKSSAIKSATGGLLVMDSGMSDVGHLKVSKLNKNKTKKFERTDREWGTEGTEPNTKTSVRQGGAGTSTPYLQRANTAPDTSTAVRTPNNEEFKEIKQEGFGKIFKMNTHHDEKGLFAPTSAEGKASQEAFMASSKALTGNSSHDHDVAHDAHVKAAGMHSAAAANETSGARTDIVATHLAAMKQHASMSDALKAKEAEGKDKAPSSKLEPGEKITYHPREVKPIDSAVEDSHYSVEAVKSHPDKSYSTSLGHLPNKFKSMDEAKAHADKLNAPTEPVTVDSTGKWNGSDLKPGEKPAEGHAIPPKPYGSTPIPGEQGSGKAKQMEGYAKEQEHASSAPDKPVGPRPIHEIAREIKRTWSKQGKGVNYAAKPYLDAMGSLESGKDSYGQDSAHSVLAYFLGNANSFRGPDAKRLKDELKQHLPKSKKEEGFTHLFKAIGPIKHGAFHEWLGKSPDQPITDADIERGLKAGGHPAKMAEFARNIGHAGSK